MDVVSNCLLNAYAYINYCSIYSFIKYMKKLNDYGVLSIKQGIYITAPPLQGSKNIGEGTESL